MRRTTYFVLGSYIVGGLVVGAALVAASYLQASNPASRPVSLSVRSAVLDIIRCAPPTHPDAWLQKAAFVPAGQHTLGGLVLRTDIYDPSDCGRSIIQTSNPANAPVNQGHTG
jgi:hypothetical protein